MTSNKIKIRKQKGKISLFVVYKNVSGMQMHTRSQSQPLGRRTVLNMRQANRLSMPRVPALARRTVLNDVKLAVSPHAIPSIHNLNFHKKVIYSPFCTG